MKFIDFFAGVGGMRRGMELAGHECVGFCENDKFAIASYTSMHLLTDEQRSRLAALSKKQRQKEILRDEYRNGEWFRDDIKDINGEEIPKADCWCFGAPCTDFSIAWKREGLAGERSGLVREVFRLLGETREEDRPEWLLYENVKGMLSSNKGYDFLAILLEMDRWGYDIEWQLLNSKYHRVPQNRERVYTIGHLRNRGRRKIFPIERSGGEHNVQINVLGTTLSTGAKGTNFRSWVYDSLGLSGALDATMYKQPKQIAVPASENTPSVWCERKNQWISVRKLTPKECFRLQGWSDDYFEKAEFVNSNTQLYRQAGNGVTVPVVFDIAKKMEEE